MVDANKLALLQEVFNKYRTNGVRQYRLMY